MANVPPSSGQEHKQKKYTHSQLPNPQMVDSPDSRLAKIEERLDQAESALEAATKRLSFLEFTMLSLSLVQLLLGAFNDRGSGNVYLTLTVALIVIIHMITRAFAPDWIDLLSEYF